MVTALRNLEKGGVRRRGSQPRSVHDRRGIAEYRRIAARIVIRLVFAKDFGDFRHFTGSDEKIHLGQFLGQFFRIALRKATGHDKLS